MSRLSALGLAVALAACGRLKPPSPGATSIAGASGADGSAGIAASTGSTGVAGTTGSSGVAGLAGTAGSASAIDAGVSEVDASADGAIDGVSPAFPFATVPGCSKDGWCWSTPTPQGNGLGSISGSSADDVWAVGEVGAIVHWDGHSWTQVPSGVQMTLQAVWADGARDAWAAGQANVVLHWDGVTWSPATVPTAASEADPGDDYWSAVWGTGPTDVWIVGSAPGAPTSGAGGAAMHWDGSQWTTTLVGTKHLDAVWGTGPDDVWALDHQAHALFHFDGQSWTTTSTGQFPCSGTATWGTSSNDLWLASECATSPSYWSSLDVAVKAVSEQISGLWGSGADDIWAVGDFSTPSSAPALDPYADKGLILHWDGLAWDEMPSTGAGQLLGVWGSRSDDVWAVGAEGNIVHWDGRAWSAPARPSHVVLSTIWGSGPDDVWAFGYDESGVGALHWNGQTWIRTELLAAAALGATEGRDTVPDAAWGSGPDDIWVSVTVQKPDPTRTGFVLCDGPAADPCYAAGSAFVHWDGRAWSLDTPDAQLVASMQVLAMWGNGPDDVWAVGRGPNTGMAIHWDGTRWSEVTTLPSAEPPDDFYSVWSSGPNDVWIGTGGVLHWDGQSWSQPISGGLGYAVGGSGPDDVWAITATVSKPSNASHWNGTSWQQLSAPDVDAATSVVSSSSTNAWLLNEDWVEHWDGTAWTPSDPGTYPSPFNLYWDGTQVWAIAMNGVIRHP